MKIDPSTTSTALDYGENPDQDSKDQGSDAQKGKKQYEPLVPHSGEDIESARDLRSRKAKKKQKKKKNRKIAERRTRQSDDESED